MPGLTERKRYMRGETKTARGDYDITKEYMSGGRVKGYSKGGKVGNYKKKYRRPQLWRLQVQLLST